MCEGNLIAEAPKLLEAAALEAFGAVAIEVIGTEFAISGGFCQEAGDVENVAVDREHCSSMSFVRAQATMAELLAPVQN